MNMTPICNDQHHHNMAPGRCPICGRVVATIIPADDDLQSQQKSLRDSEDLKKILP